MCPLQQFSLLLSSDGEIHILILWTLSHFQCVGVGFLCSFSICLWWGIGAFFVPRRKHILPVDDSNCIEEVVFNATTTSGLGYSFDETTPYTHTRNTQDNR